MVDTRTRLVTYLKATRQSQWELVYREFALGTDAPSQRTAALVIFLLLGALTPIAVFGHDIQAAFRDPSLYELKISWALAYGSLGAAYAALTSYFGYFQDYREKLERYESNWRCLLAKNGVDISGPAQEA